MLGVDDDNDGDCLNLELWKEEIMKKKLVMMIKDFLVWTTMKPNGTNWVISQVML